MPSILILKSKVHLTGLWQNVDHFTKKMLQKLCQITNNIRSRALLRTRLHLNNSTQVCFSQCGNYRNFLSSRFYVKSKMDDGESSVSKSAILTHFDFLNCNMHLGILALLNLLHSTNLFSRNIWVTEKSWNFHTVFFRNGPPIWKYFNPLWCQPHQGLPQDFGYSHLRWT